MKKRSFQMIIVFLLIAFSGFSQRPTIELVFTADNTGQHVSLNSILIENLTQGVDTTLYTPDTVFMLDYVTGMEEVSDFNGNSFSLSQNYPNPMEGKTTIVLHLPESENVVVTVSDILGREVINQEYRLVRGSHSFTFYPGRESLYFLTARADQQSRTIKMFSIPGSAFVMEFCKLKYNDTKTGSGSYKAGIMLNNFVFNLGDQLQYTASSALGNRSIIDTPTVNQTYTFQLGNGGMPCPGMPTITDIDGNTYNTAQVGNQCWMAENLKTTKYRNGALIPNVTDDNAWSNLTTGAYVWYDNDISWKDKYGALYNWFTTFKPLCPTGWHVPTNDEYTDFFYYIYGTSSNPGNNAKSCRQVNSPLGGGCNTNEHPRWDSDSSNWGTDDYGFSALPGGYRSFNGSLFYGIGLLSIWWTSTPDQEGYGYYRQMYYSGPWLSIGATFTQSGFSVRCLKD